jgi:CheY-like chemotaxis protein
VPHPLRMLVVENEPVPRQVIVEYLQRDGHVVETALDGRDGLERFHGGSFDVVVTDRAMPGMSGLELAAAIGQIAGPKPMVIMLSGFGAEVGVNGDLPPGVDVVLAKPVTLDRLRGALGSLT